MSLKQRFCLYISAATLALLSIFSLIVYREARHSQFEGAEQLLSTYIEQTWRGIAQSEAFAAELSGLEREGLYQRIWKDGVLIHNSFPEWASNVNEYQQGVTRQSQRKIHGHNYMLVAFFDAWPLLEYLSGLRKILFIACALSVFLVPPICWFLARSLLSPFRRLSEKTCELDAFHLSFRFEQPKILDEYGRLVVNFNQLLDKLEKSFTQVKNFATNASHELRTPLTVIRGEAELTLRRDREKEQYQAAMRNILNHAERLQGTISSLLYFAQLQRVEYENTKLNIPVRSLISDAVASLKRVHASREKNITISVSGEIVYRGYREVFSSIITNLVENAIKYSKCEVRVSVDLQSENVLLTVEDDGPGIPEKQKALAFEPFIVLGRKTSESHGLGLSIVKACVEAARGSISLRESRLGGLAVSVVLPGAF
jgi:signal transduction histidine kinase